MYSLYNLRLLYWDARLSFLYGISGQGKTVIRQHRHRWRRFLASVSATKMAVWEPKASKGRASFLNWRRVSMNQAYAWLARICHPFCHAARPLTKRDRIIHSKGGKYQQMLMLQRHQGNTFTYLCFWLTCLPFIWRKMNKVCLKKLLLALDPRHYYLYFW